MRRDCLLCRELARAGIGPCRRCLDWNRITENSEEAKAFWDDVLNHGPLVASLRPRVKKDEAALAEALRERDEARALVRGAYEDDCGLPWWFDWARQQGRPLPEWATDGLVEFPWPLKD